MSEAIIVSDEESEIEELVGELEVESSTSTAPVEKRFEFGEEIQRKLAAVSCRETEFLRRTEGLIKPQYFENIAHSVLVDLVQSYYKSYGKAPSKGIFLSLFKDAITSKLIPKEYVGECKQAFAEIIKEDVSDLEFLTDKITAFARHRAMEAALLKAVDLKQKGDWSAIEKIMGEALLVGAADKDPGVDYWEDIAQRTERRKEIASGAVGPTGISTGVGPLDNILYHKGWGLEELTVIMGAAKKGKSTALAHFGKNASIKGYNVMYVTLEVSGAIISDRFDANIADYQIDKIIEDADEVRKRIDAIKAGSGKLVIHEYPPDTFTPAHLRRLLRDYSARGMHFDLVIIDYLDIMAPDYVTRDPIQDSKSVWLGVRKIAKQERIAILTATQTNRDGAKNSVASDTDVADDYNKIRIADLVISINKTEQEEKNGECRLHFAASRNQKGKLTIKVKQDLDKMNFIKSVLDIY